MSEISPAVFRLKNVTIPKFSFTEPDQRFSIIDVTFEPFGIYDTSNGEFKLTMDFTIIASTEQDKKEYREVIRGNSEAYFVFESKPSMDQIPAFFYSNSMAIVFPFIRAFVSNITLQAGIRFLILPILNLTNLTEQLKKNTTALN